MKINVAKLPKWAQRHIQILENKIKEYEKRESEKDNNYPDTSVFIDNPVHGDKPLPKDTTIKMRVEKNRGVSGIRIRESDCLKNGIEIYGIETLVIVSYSSNIVHIKSERILYEDKRS